MPVPFEMMGHPLTNGRTGLFSAVKPSCMHGVIGMVGFFALFGSSINMTASLAPLSLISFDVMLVLSVKTIFAGGMAIPPGVGVPPVQFRTISPISSESPSARTVGVTPTTGEQPNGLGSAANKAGAAAATRVVRIAMRIAPPDSVTLLFGRAYLGAARPVNRERCLKKGPDGLPTGPHEGRKK